MLADKLAEAKAKTLLDTMGGVGTEALVDTLADTLTEQKAETLGITLGHVKVEVLIVTLADNLPRWRNTETVTYWAM